MKGGLPPGFPRFADFFHEVWENDSTGDGPLDPFPWQAKLAERLTAGEWPRAIALPPAAGKTDCITIAVYALAAQADRPLAHRTAPRRIWFVVDRRIVVDGAFHRATSIAEKLASATDGPLKAVADRLRTLSGTQRPLAVARLRGGILRDDGWARIPSQPAVITSTVDQLGSRLLFRGYGHTLRTAPIFAGLAANDSLIILDEAHCAVPFMQTLEAIRRYRGPDWAEEPISTPFAFVVMSATPPKSIPPGDVFPGQERTEALNHPELLQRLRTPKPAELVRVEWSSGNEGDPLVTEAVERASAFLREGRRRVAVMVNRVWTAVDAQKRLRDEVGDEADVVLLTGRIRPVDRDDLVEHWTPYLRAKEPERAERPIVVIATQCLEVGADFSFEALVTECASLDALRQRFGRLARLGSDSPAPAAILIRETDIEPTEPDPVYGGALPNTWKWLVSRASGSADGTLTIDMGVEALDAHVQAVQDLPELLAPTPDAPMLLPAHVDLLCQTAPPPHPDPDVSLYLHGKPGPPEVSVVWRCDLPPEHPQEWAETVALCPPATGELLQAPLWRVRAWLAEPAVAEEAIDDRASDIEGVDPEPDQRRPHSICPRPWRPCLLWRGRDRSAVATSAAEIAPGDVVVVPASYGIEGLGQATGAKAVGKESLDLWEAARAGTGQPPGVRLNPAALHAWRNCPPVNALLAAVIDPSLDRNAIQDAISALLAYEPQGEEEPPPPPPWWLDLLRQACSGRLLEHPGGGVLLIAPATRSDDVEPDLFADDDDLTSADHQEVLLDDHSDLVWRTVKRVAERCLPESFGDAVSLAGLWHDVGKLDPRFQLLLHQGDEVRAATAERPIAKSPRVAASPARRRAIREASGLPEGFRHEMVSLELVQRFAELPSDGFLADLVLHLVTSHHGHGRPFAPVSPDPSPPDIRGVFQGKELSLDAALRSSSPPAHRLDSGVAERFWRLTRRYGWWGLAYLECVLRLADWYARRFVATGKDEV